MIGPVLILALLAAPAAEASVGAAGVLRVAHEAVMVHGARGSEQGRTGGLLSAGDTVETGADGWAEIAVLGVGRVRLSALSSIALAGAGAPAGLSLHRGRARVEVLRHDLDPVPIRLPAHTIEARRGSSLVIELRPAGEVSIVSRSLAASVEDRHGKKVALKAGQVLEDKGAGLLGPFAGGAGMIELVDLEARAQLGDRLGVQALLEERLSKVVVRSPRAAGVRRQLKDDGSVKAAGAGTASRWLEEGIRPPPFFEDEVPPKGPNVDVEVSFGEE